MTLNGVTNSAITALFSLNSSADGINITSCSELKIDGTFIENGGSGIEMVSGNSNIVITGYNCQNNGADGIKLTATSDSILINNGFLISNTGYGINIAASTCDNAVITGNKFSGNTTDAVNDSGTGTVIRGNVGVNDNTTSAAPTSLATSLTAGENLSDGDAVVSGAATEYKAEELTSGADTSQAFSGTGANRMAYKITTSATATKITKVGCRYTATGGGMNWYARIETDNAGVPSGTAIGTYTDAAGTSNSSNVEKLMTFSTPVSVSPSTVYWVVIYGDDTGPAPEQAGGATNANNKWTTDSGSNWSNASNFDKVWYEINTVAGRVYKADANGVHTDFYNNFIGFADAAITAGNAGNILTVGIKSGLSGLTAGATYYLSDTAGAIGTSAGTNSRKVGLAISTTQLLIKNDNI